MSPVDYIGLRIERRHFLKLASGLAFGFPILRTKLGMAQGQGGRNLEDLVGREIVLWAQLTDRYVTVAATGDRLLTATADDPANAARFRLHRISGNRLALEHVSSGRFVRAGIGSSTLLGAASNRIAGWETFTGIITRSGRINLRSEQNGLFVRAGIGATSQLGATSQRADAWETFEFYPVVGSPRNIGSGLGADRTFCANGQCFDLGRFGRLLEAKLDASSSRIVKYSYAARRGRASIQGAFGPARTNAHPPARDFLATDRFNWASVSKAVTTIATLQRLERLGISPDSPIGPHLPPDWQIPGDNQRITFEQLLASTSGLRFARDENFERYDDIRQRLAVPIDTNLRGLYQYQNSANLAFGLLRILVASLDGLRRWNDNPASQTASRFISYVNREIFGPIGIANVQYRPEANGAWFYPVPTPTAPADACNQPHPPGCGCGGDPPVPPLPPTTGPGSNYGDWSLRPGSAGIHLSAVEMARFGAAVVDGTLLNRGIPTNWAVAPVGFRPISPGADNAAVTGGPGCFPGHRRVDGSVEARNGGAHLESFLMTSENGVTAALLINGTVDAGSIVAEAYRDTFQP